MSFNCKNIKTSRDTIFEFFKKCDIILIQEHWLYECQVSMLGEISDKIGHVVKGVDDSNPIEPIQMPRSYGCLAILWRQEMDSIIRPLTDCGERLQYILLTVPRRYFFCGSFMFLFCLVFAMFCARLFICALWSPAGKGLTSWLSFVVSSVSLSLSHWYPGSGVVLDCIDS